MSGDLQEQIQEIKQQVAQLQQQVGKSSSPQHQQEIIAAGLQELNFALEELQAVNTNRQQQEFERQQVLEKRVRQRTESLQQLNEQLQNEIAEHQQTLNALGLSEERFRRAIVHAPIPIMIHGEDGEIFQINQVWTDITGYTQSDIPTIPDWTQHAYGERHEAVKAYIDQLYDRNTSVDDGEFPVTTRHGETRIWEFYSAPLGQLPDGKRLAISMARDITERKRAETALQESERRLSELAKNIPGSIYRFVLHTDGSYSIPYMSPGSQRVFELEVSEIEENSAILINLIHPDDRQSFEDSVTASAETLDDWHWEGRCITSSGELKWLRSASCPKKQANGDVLWDGLLMDITNCKNIEFALQESELRFRQLADNISQVFWVATPDLSQMLYVSPACERVWGRSQASLYEQPDSWLDAIHSDDCDRVVAVLKNQRDEPRSGEYRVVHPDGSVRWVRFYRFPVRNQAGEIYQFVGIEEDFSNVYDELRLRQQAEETIRRQEQKFRALADNAPDIIARFDRQLRHLYVNPAVAQASGKPPEAFIGKTNREIGMAEPNTLVWEQVIHRIFETGVEDTCEFSHVTPNGLRYYQSRYVPEFAADGTVESVLGIGRDITELKQAEKALTESEQRFRTSIENMLDCFGIYTSIRDESGQITDFRTEYLNAAACENDRVRKEEVIGKGLCELLPNHWESGLFDEYVQVVETGQPLVKEDVIYEEVYGEERLTRAYDIRIVKLNDGFVAIWRDITQRKLADEALRQSEEHLRLVVQNMPVMLDAWDRNKTLIAWNRECEQVTGYTAAEIIGNPRAFEMLYPDTDYLESMMTEWEERGSEYRDWEWTLTSKDGQLKTIAWYNISESFPIQDWLGWAIGVDITERKLAEVKMAQALEQERELNELKSNFIAIASHQFRTPLTTIFSSAELLERYRDRFSEEKQLTHLGRIQTAVQQMTLLLDDVLLVGKAGAGKLEFNPTPIDVVQFCEDLVEELQLSDKNRHSITFAHQGNCKKAVEGTNDMLPLLDEKYLRHIFDNLLSNAIKYSPDGGTVRFDLVCFCDRVKRSYSKERASARQRSPLALPLALAEGGRSEASKRGEVQASADRAVFQVQDEGIGIPPEDIPHLFETFHRARNVGLIQGTGLGLAIVKQCVDLHGGEILVESEVGSGTTFTVTLPLNYSHQSNTQ
ncbi:MAG: PAS domain S-box protein [Microcoleus sp. SIO2G3]|nr:PAS domain S-box protein [Microcoleus sp. SIO2G3]